MNKITDFRVRIPSEIHTAVADEAKKNGRSTNAEYVYRLEESLKTDDLLRQELSEIKQRLAEIEKILSGDNYDAIR